MGINIAIPPLGDKFVDYRQDIAGESYFWGPVVNAAKVRYLCFHHSVTPQTAKTDGNWKAECDRIAREHLNQGWGGIGYRFVICSDGTVAYVGDLSHGGSAVTGNNDIIFSTCLVGDFTKELPTAAQVHSAYVLQDFFRNHMPAYPLINSEDSIIGHQDAYTLLHLPGATPTACPGPAWRTGADTLRDRILHDRFSGYPDPQPANLPAPQPPPVEMVTIPKTELENYKTMIETQKGTIQGLTRALALKDAECQAALTKQKTELIQKMIDLAGHL